MLVLLRVSAVRAVDLGIYQVELVITVVYATVLVLSAPVNIVMSRFASDRVYERRADAIAAPLRRALAATLLAFAVAGTLIGLVLGLPAGLAIGCISLTVIVGAQWLLLSAAGGLSNPSTILRAFAAGAPVSVVAAIGLARIEGFEASGYLYGFGLGQLVTMTWLLHGTFSVLPAEDDDSARIGPAFVQYWLLGLAALMLQGGIWIDKLVVYFQHGGTAASSYAALAALAWLTVVPTCAYLFVQVETRFYRGFKAFYDAVEQGAPLAELDEASAQVDSDTRRVLLSTAALQLVCTAIAITLAERVTTPLGLGADPWTARVLLLGATMQVVSLCATLLLHYFDFQWEALAAAGCMLIGNGVLTAVIGDHLPIGTGYALACTASSAVAILLLAARLRTLLRDTYQSQPYGAEG